MQQTVVLVESASKPLLSVADRSDDLIPDALPSLQVEPLAEETILIPSTNASAASVSSQHTCTDGGEATSVAAPSFADTPVIGRSLSECELLVRLRLLCKCKHRL